MPALEGKVAIVTGSGRGIGRASAERLAADGCQVVVAELDAVGGTETAARICDRGGNARFVLTDVTEPASVEQLVNVTIATFGRLDVLHNNAGGSTTRDGPVTEVAIDEWWRTINVDLFGTFLGCRFAIPAMIASGGGSVINMASIVALVGTSHRDAYTAAKGAIAALTRSVAKNFVRQNVRVNAIAPGGIATERILAMMGDDAERWLDSGPGLPPIGHPDDIAAMVAFLASDNARLITGAVIPVDSGQSSFIDFG